jgi:glycosyltransferase involved in cell wall biosynthesis
MARPRISIIIPSHGRPAALNACLESLDSLDYPTDRFEIVIVDDGSPQPLEPVIESWKRRLPVRGLKQARLGPAAARNTGIKVASGEFVAFTADDCRPQPDWLARLASRFEAAPDTAVGGRIENGLANNIYSTSTDLLIRYLYEYYNTAADQARFFTPNNLAFPAAALREEGGFRESFPTGEDRDLCNRWREAGRNLVYANEIVVRHVHPLNPITFCALHFRYGQGSFRFRQDNVRRNPGTSWFEPLSFYLNLVGSPLRRRFDARGLAMSALLGLAQLANATGFAYEAMRR